MKTKELLKLIELYNSTDKFVITSNINKLIKEKNIKYKNQYLAEACGIKCNTVNMWFSKYALQNRPSLENLCKIAIALNVDIEKFLER